ncbi:MAG: response regulator [Candidatus Aminicenantes bacterium]|nr:response regulator [Candidatus Aminicenantes bacterium]NIM84466.1 response regulator [Candidatus Aminicenantes bacterium]NIN23987.1 response regulator [Candidatus Aminicenantes bacterium]NIN47701.1 response regulator [Candidatus Aminicenantes bacterium]NIN90631.1 response regulator [Candidatus Aminicenantes bacterium]
MKKVLLLDDEKHIREDLGNELRESGYAVHTAEKVEEARKIILSEEIDYAFIDLKLDYSSEYSGIKVVNFAKRNQPKLKAIILSAYPFEQVKAQLRKELEEEIGYEKILKEIEEDYIYKGGEQNYIDAVLDKLKELKQVQEIKNCFVIMPFSSTNSCTEDEWSEIFENVIKPAVEKSGFNYKCERANLPFGSIIEDILDNLNRSELVIADLTDRNPNVLYELGVRHTIGSPAIMTAQSKADIPFDLLSYSFIIYGWKTKKEKDKFKKQIKEVIAYLEENPHKAVSPVRKYLNPIGEES